MKRFFSRPYVQYRLPHFLFVIVSLTYLIYFGSYATQRYLAFETGAFDVGVYAQPLWNYLQGRGFALSIVAADHGLSRWATHVEPILFLILPLYRLWPDPRTLLWLQVSALSLAALPLYVLALRRLQNAWAALVIVLTYFLMPATEAVTLFDFHAVALAPLFLLAAIYFLDLALEGQGQSFWLWPQKAPAADRDNLSAKMAYVLSALFFLLALSTKEDISLHVFMVGIYLLALRRRWKEGTLLVGVGVVWFYIAFQVIIPAFRIGGGQSVYLAWFETLGDTPLEVVLSPLTAPDKVLALVFRADNLPALGMLTLSLALLPLIGLPLLILAAPSLAFSLLSQNPTLRQLETWHYAAPMLPFVMLAAIDGLARLNYVLSHYQFPLKKFTKIPFAASIFRLSPYILPTLLLVTALIYHNLRGYSPLAQLDEWPEITPHHDLGRAVAAMIPPEAAVLAQAQLLPYVAHRAEVIIWDGPLLTDYDYIWMDLSHHKLPNRFNAHGEFLTGLVIETNFGPVVANDGYLLLEKGAKRETIPDTLFSFTAFDHLPVGTQPVNATFGETFTLIGVKPEIRRLATSETEPQIVLFFETIKKPAVDYFLFLYLLDEQGAIIGATDYAQPALFWWPTSRWERGDRRQVRVNTIPWWTGDKTTFGYALGLSRRDDPWDAAARLPVKLNNPSSNSAEVQLIAGKTLLPLVAFQRFAGLPYPKPLTILQTTGSEVVER